MKETYSKNATVAIVTIAVGQDYQNRVSPGIESKRAYCKQHGYDFICCQDSLDPSRHIYWSKILLALQVMDNPNLEWIVWMDADTLIMNHGITIEDIVEEKNHFLISIDRCGVNTGVFFIRNCAWSVQFLRNVYNRTDCFSHCFPEQTAVALELEKMEFRSHARIVPQRIFNSYPSEIIGYSLNSTYQSGDFIIHFPSARNDDLSYLFNKYSFHVINDREKISVDHYLGYYGFKLSPVHSQNNEGYVSDDQKQQFKEHLAIYPNIQSILEIGLNGGHSAEIFFQCCKNLKRFSSFDINMHAYTSPAAEYFSLKQKGKFEFVQGDSAITVPQYAEQFPDRKFDLIYVDGDHTFEACTQDVLNCKKLAHADTVLWVDDCSGMIRDAMILLHFKKVIEIKDVYHSSGNQGGRSWMQARYL
jgi:galactosyl transferase GMA12/MNN10 family/Methyltransferase domain